MRDSKDIDLTRLTYFNKGLKFLTETLQSDNTHLKGNFHALYMKIGFIGYTDDTINQVQIMVLRVVRCNVQIMHLQILDMKLQMWFIKLE